MARPPIPIMSGTRFGRLTVAADREGKARRVLVACDCGSPPKLVYVSELRRRKNPLRSCGCGREIGWENLRTGWGTSSPGEKNGSAKLTKGKVRAIRARLEAGESARSVAKRYGIGLSQLGRIARRESWRHVE